MMRTNLYLFRAAFVLALVVGSYLATTDAVPGAVASVNDKLTHAGAFLVLAFLLDQCFSPRLHAFWTPVALPLFCYGLGVELVQDFLPYRQFDLLDLLADCAGLVAYWLLRPLISKIPFLPRPPAY
jgi:VanZ family protein